MDKKKEKIIKNMEKGAEVLLQGLADFSDNSFTLDDPNFEETPKRIAKAFREMCSGLNKESEVYDILGKNFPSKYEGMVIIDNIRVFSMCPHHFIPVEYTVDFGYIPNGLALGLSKIPRFIDILAKRPVLQEDFTKECIDLFSSVVKPAGCIVVVNGQHGCMRCRGARQTNSSAITSAVNGFFENADTRQEFLELIKMRRI